MPQYGEARVRRRFWQAGAMAAALLVLMLAGCSTSGSGSSGGSISLGLAGSTADHASQPPQIAANGPSGTYAFVFDNQVWLHTGGQTGNKQLTHQVLSNGANIAWGPLVWSPNGKYIAFALVQDLTPSSVERSTGPIYYVRTDNGDTFSTGASGSVYGHTYAWYDDKALMYSVGGSVMLYDLGDADPRVWPVLSPTNGMNAGTTRYYSTDSTGFGDLSVTSDRRHLFVTQYSLSSLGSVGQSGSATLHEFSLSGLSLYDQLTGDDPQVPQTLSAGVQRIQYADLGLSINLGAVYTDSEGNLATGTWQISSGGSTLVAQHVDNVDTKAGVLSSHFIGCTNADYYNCGTILQAAGKQPLATHGGLSVAPGGNRVAYASNSLYLQNLDGGGASTLAGASWNTAPAWSSDAKRVVMTQLVKSSTDVAGVRRDTTQAVVFDGKSSGTLILGAQNVSWLYS